MLRPWLTGVGRARLGGDFPYSVFLFGIFHGKSGIQFVQSPVSRHQVLALHHAALHLLITLLQADLDLAGDHVVVLALGVAFRRVDLVCRQVGVAVAHAVEDGGLVDGQGGQAKTGQ